MVQVDKFCFFCPFSRNFEKEKPLLPKSGFESHSFSCISKSYSAKWTGYKRKELSLTLLLHPHVDIHLYHISQGRCGECLSNLQKLLGENSQQVFSHNTLTKKSEGMGTIYRTIPSFLQIPNIKHMWLVLLPLPLHSLQMLHFQKYSSQNSHSVLILFFFQNVFLIFISYFLEFKGKH